MEGEIFFSIPVIKQRQALEKGKKERKDVTREGEEAETKSCTLWERSMGQEV